MTTREQHRAAAPEDIITATLQRQGDAGPAYQARAVIADLTGHGYVIKRNPKTATIRRDCTEHPGTETPGGNCPSCPRPPDTAGQDWI